MKQVLGRDENGKPTHILEDTGFMQVSRPYNEKADGYIDDLVYPDEFIAVRMGDEVKHLVSRINSLIRENHRLRSEVEVYRKASGF